MPPLQSRRPVAGRATLVVLLAALSMTVAALPSRAVVIEDDSRTANAAVAARKAETGDWGWSLPACTGSERFVPDDPATHWDHIVLDPVWRLEPGWQPDDLVDVPALGSHTDGEVRAIIVDDLVRMHAAAEAEDVAFDVVSGFRSDTQQDYVYTSHIATLPPQDLEGPPTVAPPGHSEHQLGTTIDVIDPSDPTTTTAFGSKPAADWLASNAPDFGFILSYPEGGQSTTCYGWEPWHLRWVGIDRARQIDASGLSPREFLLREAANQLP